MDHGPISPGLGLLCAEFVVDIFLIQSIVWERGRPRGWLDSCNAKAASGPRTQEEPTIMPMEIKSRDGPSVHIASSLQPVLTLDRRGLAVRNALSHCCERRGRAGPSECSFVNCKNPTPLAPCASLPAAGSAHAAGPVAAKSFGRERRSRDGDRNGCSP
jgi:hypothetical protein